MKLFPRDKVVGIFKGFSQGGMEVHADVIVPYRNEYQSVPMHGMFLLVQLENENEGVLGRITAIEAQGRLSSGGGEDYGIRAISEERSIPEDLREQYLKYRLNIRVLGILRTNRDQLVFAASHRRLPHVGSKVAFLSDELLQEVCGHNEKEGAELGYLALGEFIFSGNEDQSSTQAWMRPMKPRVVPKFDVRSLVARRSFVFARAGFGKSNLIKLLFSDLYETDPTVKKRRGNAPVGTIIFDPEGEYFWPDDKNRPGLCDVPHLRDKVVVFTKKEGPSGFYNSFVVGDIRLDIRRLRPADVLSIALSPEKQDQQNVRKLKGLSDNAWARLVDEIYRNKNAADEKLIQELLSLRDNQEAELVAARANMTTVVTMLHDPGSQMLDMLFRALSDGKICIVDVSQLRGAPALVLSGLILKKIFDHNQDEFTKADPKTIPTIAVLEEAQSVLGGDDTGGEGPYISWVKEGRKYDLGAVLITQQPGSISGELLSQGDNWFIFHLLSSFDLQSVKRANAHFSDDLLSSLLNEPIPGHAVFWSSVSGRTYPLPLRIFSFEEQFRPLDSDFSGRPVRCYAGDLKKKFSAALEESAALSRGEAQADEEYSRTAGSEEEPTEESGVDALNIHLVKVISSLKQDQKFQKDMRDRGLPWRGVMEKIKGFLPEIMHDRDNVAHHNMKLILNRVFGDRNWDTEKRPSKSITGGTTTWVVLKGSTPPPPGES